MRGADCWLSRAIDNFCSIQFKLLWLLNYLEFLTTSSQLQKQKTINFSTQIQNNFLTSFSWAVVTFVVPNLSHSDCLKLPVTVDNKLLATKKKGQSYFAYLANKYGITYLPQLPSISSSFFSINNTAFNQQSALRIPPKKAKFRKLSLVKGLQCLTNWSQQLFVTWKTSVFAGILSQFGAQVSSKTCLTSAYFPDPKVFPVVYPRAWRTADLYDLLMHLFGGRFTFGVFSTSTIVKR